MKLTLQSTELLFAPRIPPVLHVCYVTWRPRWKVTKFTLSVYFSHFFPVICVEEMYTFYVFDKDALKCFALRLSEGFHG